MDNRLLELSSKADSVQFYYAKDGSEVGYQWTDKKDNQHSVGVIGDGGDLDLWHGQARSQFLERVVNNGARKWVCWRNGIKGWFKTASGSIR